ncbi:hypothetical protein PsYK624_070590 [Phanerochaete sordida]|uniref:Uncharacterized protein n=1 Tax=Phanerochaete sordida TaxID=48140 RepID=A0A9P3LDZ1_9APHY|nr:hypothetical protein PsYK624_070590 [Phanerochaete sordida]
MMRVGISHGLALGYPLAGAIRTDTTDWRRAVVQIAGQWLARRRADGRRTRIALAYLRAFLSKIGAAVMHCPCFIGPRRRWYVVFL